MMKPMHLAFDEFVNWLNGVGANHGREDAASYRRWEHQRWVLETTLQTAWASYYGLKRAGVSHWQSLFNQRFPHGPYAADWRTPEGDHMSVWRRIGSKGFEPTEVFVSQPYGVWPSLLDKMKAFANEHGLRFWASERPAWHYPGQVLHVEWARPESAFCRQRDTVEADLMQRTIYCHGKAGEAASACKPQRVGAQCP
jgi:hypothetical protein